MRGPPCRLPYWPWLRRPIDSPPRRSSPVSWSLSKESATAQRAPPGQDAGFSGRPARTRSTIRRHVASGHCQGSSAADGCGETTDMTTSLGEGRSRDRQNLSGYPSGIVRGEEQHRVCNVLRLTEPAHGGALDHRFLPGLAIGLPLPLVVRTRAEEPGRYRVHGDAVGAE